jgi:hypothetical protein
MTFRDYEWNYTCDILFFYIINGNHIMQCTTYYNRDFFFLQNLISSFRDHQVQHLTLNEKTSIARRCFDYSSYWWHLWHTRSWFAHLLHLYTPSNPALSIVSATTKECHFLVNICFVKEYFVILMRFTICHHSCMIIKRQKRQGVPNYVCRIPLHQ